MKIYKGMTNLEIAELLRAVAASYQLKGEAKNRFRIIAYQRAADAVEHASSELKDLWDEEKLDEVPGIGESIAGYLNELFKTGHSRHFEEVMRGYPTQMFELMKIPGIGAKTAYKLTKELNISGKDPIASLEKAAISKKIEVIEGMGADSQSAILKSIKEVRGRTVRLLLPYAERIADEIISWLEKSKYIKRADALGSLRRRASSIGDVDIAASVTDARGAIDHFTKFPNATRTLEKGDRTASIIIPGNRQVDLMVEKPESYGALLQHFTGSKHHNIALREHALKKGYSVSDYGIKKLITNHSPIQRLSSAGGKSQITKFKTEKQFYNFLGMEWIPPELREDTGEIKMALEHKLPKLIELSDVQADLQIHSDFKIETSHDLGESSMEEIIGKSNSLGYEYIAFTEHNPSQSGHNKKQIIDILKRKKEVVDQINDSFVKSWTRLREISSMQVKKVFNSLEIDILPDGGLPVTEDGLNLLDFALVSIHSSFKQSRESMTKRVLSGLSHPKVKIFAHPTTRKINLREGIELEWDKIFEFCLKNDKWLEINADPMRLDLPDYLVKEAIEKGVRLTLGTDAHHADGMDNMQFAVSVARRGWAQKKDIVNTRSLEDFEEMLR